MLIVGSKALNYHFPSLNREVKDIDIIGTEDYIKYLTNKLNPESIKETENITTLFNIKNQDDFFNTKNVEILNANNSIALTEYINFDTQNGLLGNGLRYASPEVLLSLKKSHINFPIKFEKHIKDYNFLLNFLKEDKLEKITTINFQETEKRLGKLKTPSLMKSNMNFFGQSNGYVKYFYIHDDIHKVMAHYDKPVYEYMQVDPLSAWCEKDMWNQFTFEKKAKCVLEEAYVIALERKIIPMLNGCGEIISSKKAFDWAIMRICTTLCSGWFRKFATDNYIEIIKYYNPDYVKKFLKSESDGLIKKQINNI
jgi:hypothetical protein